MAHFETFRKTLVPLKRTPTITVQRRGTMSLNKAAHVLLGCPPAVELLFDAETHVIGLRAVDPRADHAYSVRTSTGSDTGPFVVSAMAFLHFYDIFPTHTLRWPAQLVEGVMCISLRDEATPVTSNRARHAQGLSPMTAMAQDEQTGIDEKNELIEQGTPA